MPKHVLCLGILVQFRKRMAQDGNNDREEERIGEAGKDEEDDGTKLGVEASWESF